MDEKKLGAISFLAIFTILGIAGYYTLPDDTFSIGSASTIEYEESSDFWQGEMIVVSWLADTSTENLNVHLDAGEMESYTGEPIDDSIEISVEDTKAEATYGVTSGGSDIVPLDNFQVQHHSHFGYTSVAEDWADDNCDWLPNGDRPIVIEGAVGGYGSNDVYCYEQTGTDGNVGRFATPSVAVETEFEITNLDTGDSTSQTIGTGDAGDGMSTFFHDQLGNRIAHIEWQGNLHTGESEPQVQNELVHYDALYDDWTIINENQYMEWYNFWNLHSADRLQDVAEGFRSETQVNNEISSLEDEAQSSYFESELYGGGTFEGGSFLDGSYVFSDENQMDIYYPEYRLALRGAEFITIDRPIGQPEIVGIISETNNDGNLEVAEMSQRDVRIEVMNVGDAEGEFGVNLDCSMADSFSSTRTTDTQPLSPSDSYTYIQEVSFSAEDDIEDACLIQAFDVSDPQNTMVTQDLGVQGDTEAECTQPGEYFPNEEDGEILFCNADNEVELAQQCEEGENPELVEGGQYQDEDAQTDFGYECVEEEDPDHPDHVGECETQITEGGLLTDGITTTDPVCEVQKGLQGLLEGTADAIKLFDIAMAVIGAFFVMGFVIRDVGRQVEGSVPQWAIVTGGVLGGIITGFGIWSLMSGILPNVILAGVIISVLFIKSMIPGQ